MNKLRCFFFSDLLPEERACVESCLDELSKTVSIERIRVTNYHRWFFQSQSNSGPSWIVSHDWQSALDFLQIKKAKSPIFVSVFSSATKKSTPLETWLKSFQSPLSSGVKLLSHSPLSYKFFRELAGIPEVQMKQIPLPFPPLVRRKDSKHFTVGTYGAFRSENNLHFIATLAHYLAKKDPQCFFRVLGSGPLYSHLNQLVSSLGISQQFIVSETTDIEDVCELDVFLYVPHRNDHFAPLLLAGATGAVPVCLETPGIQDYVKDSYSGFIVAEDDTKTMSELILTLKQNPLLRNEMVRRFSDHIQSRFCSEKLAPDYAKIFGVASHQTKNYVRREL
ncbi:MAG: glycosyltransferase [Proteobacteria bacterium]|nr:glycosyltransferase [Pseudomonadota bacterium]NDC24003.1 glycosyltransferase [Pseudomonadota bacterium]NDD05524.1 glycosyltransferase [Pseudomonadota bacterium]NDG26651.1 glycosyltransferase [Pseudomonadota bacterium]